MKRRICVLSVSLVACTFLLSSCSSDPTSVARTLLDQKCETESQGYLRIVTFVKKDAVTRNVFGVDYYNLTYSTEVEALKDGGYINICEFEGSSHALTSYKVRDQANHGDCFVFKSEKGHRYQLEASKENTEMTLAKHESGWVIDSR